MLSPSKGWIQCPIKGHLSSGLKSRCFLIYATVTWCYCDDSKEMVLVYEYMPRGTLDYHLHKADTPLSWVQRLNISIGAARGLDYLHTGVGTSHGIIHRDVKSSNILLDEDWEPKISDFGLSKIGPRNQQYSYVSASIKGTFGYLDPEFWLSGKLTRKTDVFAFGVVLFELLSGRPAVDTSLEEENCSLVRWAQKCFREKKLNQILDSRIKGQISPKCLKVFAQIAYRCLDSCLTERPMMAEVVVALHLSLELQEKFDKPAQPTGVMGFTRKMHKFIFVSPEANSVDSTSSVEMHSANEKIPASPLQVPPSPGRSSMSPKLDSVGSVHLNMSQVVKATQKFSPSLKLGEGVFGTVYKAQLPDGQVVAIKRAKKLQFRNGIPFRGTSRPFTVVKVLYLVISQKSKQSTRAFAEQHSDDLQSEFRSEVELVAKIDHRNLVKLLGYVDEGNERLIIMEYVPNGTLREHLDGVHGSYLDFSQLLEISIDVAHGLTYLHLCAEKQIIHRGVGSSNILLTGWLRAKLADFGFAWLGDSESDKTHVSTNIKGTVGYLDPQYMRTYQLTPKSDVYSFGALLIEILTGRRPVDLRRPLEERVTIRWVFRKYMEGEIMDLVDPQMKEALDEEIFAKMLCLAFQCVAPTREDRPDMKSVGEQLWAIRMDYLKHGRRV